MCDWVEEGTEYGIPIVSMVGTASSHCTNDVNSRMAWDETAKPGMGWH